MENNKYNNEMKTNQEIRKELKNLNEDFGQPHIEEFTILGMIQALEWVLEINNKEEP